MPNEPIIFPDAELWATGYIRTVLGARSEPYAAAVHVNNKVPASRYERMVVVRRDGGPRIDTFREVARLGINVWGRTEQEVTDLARLVRALLGSAADGDPAVGVSELSGPMPIADESGQPRRFFTIEAVLRGVNLAS